MKKLMKKRITLRWQIILLTFTVLLTSFLVSSMMIIQSVDRRTENYLEQTMNSFGRIASHSPLIVNWLTNGVPWEQALIEYATLLTDMSELDVFIIENQDGEMISNNKAAYSIMKEEIIRISAPGELPKVLESYMHVSLPVLSDEGNPLGYIHLGKFRTEVDKAIREQVNNILITVTIGHIVGLFGAFMLADHIKKVMHNMEPYEIAKHLEETEAILDSVKEGIIAVDKNMKVTLVNGSVHRLFKQKYPVEMIEAYFRNQLPEVSEVLKSGKEMLQLETEIDGISLLGNCLPILVEGQVAGALMTFQDKTELKKMSNQLADIQIYSDTLRAQSHEFMNKLHVVLGLVQMKEYEKLHDYIGQVVNLAESETTFTVEKIKNAVIAGFILGKRSKAREEGMDFVLMGNSSLPDIEDEKLVHSLIHIIGNLLNNAMESIDDFRVGQISLGIFSDPGHIYIEVSDNGSGISRQMRESLMTKGFSTKGRNRGFGLYIVNSLLRELGGEIRFQS